MFGSPGDVKYGLPTSLADMTQLCHNDTCGCDAGIDDPLFVAWNVRLQTGQLLSQSNYSLFKIVHVEKYNGTRTLIILSTALATLNATLDFVKGFASRVSSRTLICRSLLL